MSDKLQALKEDHFSGGANIAPELRALLRDIFKDGVTLTRPVTIPAGAGGAADDVTIPGLTGLYKLVDAAFICTVGNAAARTATLRTAAAGGGTALTDALDCTATGRKRNAVALASQAITASQNLFLRRSDSALGGELLLQYIVNF